MNSLSENTDLPDSADAKVLGGSTQEHMAPHRITLNGHLIFLVHARGSKSESWAPHLVVDPSNVHRLHRDGDNPFLESSLTLFHGRHVAVHGHWEPSGRFLVVEDCQACPPPFPVREETLP